MGKDMPALTYNRLFLLALIVVVPLIALIGSASAGVINASTFSKVAIEGTDPVAYFTESRAVEGKSNLIAEWNGAVWRFVSEENRKKFESDPARYAPQYGGYCAWAVSKGYTASIDPNAWSIVDGKLYLNYSKNVRKDWQVDAAGNIAKADANWPKLKADLE